eukprot:6910298-Pyramimonas_sp.AAC.1
MASSSVGSPKGRVYLPRFSRAICPRPTCVGLVRRENIPTFPASRWSVVRIFFSRLRRAAAGAGQGGGGPVFGLWWEALLGDGDAHGQLHGAVHLAPHQLP